MKILSCREEENSRFLSTGIFLKIIFNENTGNTRTEVKNQKDTFRLLVYPFKANIRH